MILTIAESLPFLRTPTEECDPTGPEAAEAIAALRNEATKLEATLGPNSVAGLAANQIGIGLSIAIVKLGDDADFTELINPSILYHLAPEQAVSEAVGDLAVSVEACFSAPGEYYAVRRHRFITCASFDRYGKPEIRKLAGFDAVKVQHEVDHLNGTLISDIGQRVQPAASPA